MGILKLIIAALVIGSITVIIRELMKRSKKAKIAQTLNEELDKVNDELLKADVEGDVIEARTALKVRRAELDQKLEDLANGILPKDNAPEPEAPTPPAGRTIKEGEQPVKPVAPKKKVAKKKVVKKKAAPKKKTTGSK